jgi:V/A-type H+-transporting ATPase subunit B
MLVVHTRIVDIVGDIIRIRVATFGSGRAGGPCLGDLARVTGGEGFDSLAQVIKIDGNWSPCRSSPAPRGSPQPPPSSSSASPMQVTYSTNILGRVFRGDGELVDTGPDLGASPRSTPAARR